MPWCDAFLQTVYHLVYVYYKSELVQFVPGALLSLWRQNFNCPFAPSFENFKQFVFTTYSELIVTLDWNVFRAAFVSTLLLLLSVITTFCMNILGYNMNSFRGISCSATKYANAKVNTRATAVSSWTTSCRAVFWASCTLAIRSAEGWPFPKTAPSCGRSWATCCRWHWTNGGRTKTVCSTPTTSCTCTVVMWPIAKVRRTPMGRTFGWACTVRRNVCASYVRLWIRWFRCDSMISPSDLRASVVWSRFVASECGEGVDVWMDSCADDAFPVSREAQKKGCLRDNFMYIWYVNWTSENNM